MVRAGVPVPGPPVHGPSSCPYRKSRGCRQALLQCGPAGIEVAGVDLGNVCDSRGISGHDHRSVLDPHTGTRAEVLAKDPGLAHQPRRAGAGLHPRGQLDPLHDVHRHLFGLPELQQFGRRLRHRGDLDLPRDDLLAVARSAASLALAPAGCARGHRADARHRRGAVVGQRAEDRGVRLGARGDLRGVVLADAHAPLGPRPGRERHGQRGRCRGQGNRGLRRPLRPRHALHAARAAGRAAGVGPRADGEGRGLFDALRLEGPPHRRRGGDDAGVPPKDHRPPLRPRRARALRLGGGPRDLQGTR
mmetsp:Transcript_51462/g.129958  ORF Transcript_51462/g.129958 Transcript_51462/m.129958 type:complete len:304 (+) Transcript_51462:1174-2085(+)